MIGRENGADRSRSVELNVSGWVTEQFLTAVTEGVKPNGDTLDAERMPWELFAKFNREELEAVHLYLGSLLEQD